jgi:hypothetical protein
MGPNILFVTLEFVITEFHCIKFLILSLNVEFGLIWPFISNSFANKPIPLWITKNYVFFGHEKVRTSLTNLRPLLQKKMTCYVRQFWANSDLFWVKFKFRPSLGRWPLNPSERFDGFFHKNKPSNSFSFSLLFASLQGCQLFRNIHNSNVWLISKIR